MGIKAGTAILTYEGVVELDGVKVNKVTFLADGFNFLDEEILYLDLDGWRPIKVERKLNIFGNKEEIVEHYKPDGTIEIVKTASGKRTQQSLKKDAAIDNIYGLIYRLREKGNLSVGQSVDVHLPTKDFKITVEKSKPLKAAGQKYQSVFLRSQPGKYQIWMDSSYQHLPLRISGAIGIANTSMVMESYEQKTK